jgi:predicted nuclease of restriction endonuclease-like (RecB) superfamily
MPVLTVGKTDISSATLPLPNREEAMKLDALIRTIAEIHTRSQETAGQALNRLLSLRNWLIGAYIIEYEQRGEDRAAYGERLLHRLAAGLVEAGVKGLRLSNLKNCRQVALAYPELDPHIVTAGLGPDDTLPKRQTSGVFSDPHQIRQTSGELATQPHDVRSPSAGAGHPFPSLLERARATEPLEWRDGRWLARLFSALSFSHLLELSRIDAPLQRAFYELHCLKESWSIRELKRQRGTMLFERAGLSKDKASLMALAKEGAFPETPQAVLRDPYVLEFLDLESRPHFTESDLEQALLDHLQTFLLELGSDFCFMSRQYRISTGTNHHFLDLLLYHRGLRCLVAIDLKAEAFRHEHAGQMNFYVNYLADHVAKGEENRPIGVILCTDKDAAEVHYATAGIERSVFVSRYLAQLPSEDQLAQWLREERALLEMRREGDDG